ncbi:MAG: asparagine synthase (glutamine-hydrolyzing) [Desulfovibrionaceae bacterium]|nr:asparagine synthase (glutamine-hydrolyzing) [Desulfovibrionaceae bacterium]MBF0515032.1 asparagine synthase (glutamine-hydrolyzing) [Desulfovibrionaceae bacterium]
MCGIAGFVAGPDFAPGDGERRRLLAAMAGTMAHRGPDGQGLWLENEAALGHRRLSIIDLAAGAQPMLDADGRAAVTFNGEIYNFLEIRRELEAKGFVFRTNSDTEVLLNGYLAWGEGCLDRFEGMFAFALWDRKRRVLFAARDRYGKKPLYYTLQNGVFAFASELTALRVLPCLRFETPRAMLAKFLAHEYAPAPETIFRGVHKLEPAHCLILEAGRIVTRPYWDLPVPDASTRESEADLGRRLIELLDAATARRLVSDVPLGVFLSGGLDSSAVAALMARHCSLVKTFSIGFEEASYDESKYARLVASGLGTEHHERILNATRCGELLPSIVERFDEPMSDPSIVPTFLLSGATREKVTVALGGDGGDELFAGYETFYAFKLAEWLSRLPSFASGRLLDAVAARLPMSAGYVNPRLAAQTFLAGAKLPRWLRVQRWLSAFSPELLSGVLAGGESRCLAQETLYARTRELYERYPSTDPLAKIFYVYARQYMLDYILVKVDRCSMLQSLEVRAPFLDRDVAEFVWRLPVSLKLRGFTGKYLLRRALSGIVPPQVLSRPKRGFLIPVSQWLRGVLGPLMEELLGEEHLRAQGLFNPAPVGRLVAEHLAGTADHRRPLWTLLVLQIWLRKNDPSII